MPQSVTGRTASAGRRRRNVVSAEVRRYLKTLRRIPNDVMLAVGTREFAMGEGDSCLCGWAIREKVAECRELADAGTLHVADVGVMGSNFREIEKCVELFGGRYADWEAIYWGVVRSSTVPLIEEAFTLRVMEAVEGRRLVA